MQHDSSIEIGALSEKSKVIPLVLVPVLALFSFYLFHEKYITEKREEKMFS